MTNTKFRKRALLSSVAMLLVALVALGSATFAWFVANPEVKADGVTANTAAATGIRIASDTALAGKTGAAELAEYKETTQLYTTAVSLQPASPKADTIATFTIGDSVWKEAKATKASESTWNSAAPTDVTAANKFTTGTNSGNVYYEDIWMYSTDNVAVKKLAVNLNAAAEGIGQGLKVAVVAYNPGADAGEEVSYIGTWAADTAAGNTTGTYTSDAAGFTTAYTNLKASGSTQAVNITTNNSPRSANGTTPAARIRIYVYLDGAHKDVYSNNATQLTDLLASGKSIEIKMSTSDAAGGLTFD